MLQERSVKTEVRYEAAITIGSLAKGKDDHVKKLLNCDPEPISVLLTVLEEDDDRLNDACLSCLKTFAQNNKSLDIPYTAKHFQKLLSFIGPTESLIRQSRITNILSHACKSFEEQNILSYLGAAQIFPVLLGVHNTAIRIHTLACMAAFCYKNPMIAHELVETTYRCIQVPKLLSPLVSRDKPVEMQLEAARCLTNLYRAGALNLNDRVILFQTLPCLVRLCQVSSLSLFLECSRCVFNCVGINSGRVQLGTVPQWTTVVIVYRKIYCSVLTVVSIY